MTVDRLWLDARRTMDKWLDGQEYPIQAHVYMVAFTAFYKLLKAVEHDIIWQQTIAEQVLAWLERSAQKYLHAPLEYKLFTKHLIRCMGICNRDNFIVDLHRSKLTSHQNAVWQYSVDVYCITRVLVALLPEGLARDIALLSKSKTPAS